MPPKNKNNLEFFYEVNGKVIPFNGIMSLDECTEIVNDVKSALSTPEYFKGDEMTFKIPQKEYRQWKKTFRSVIPRYFTNNWRKMHHLPIVRRRRKNENKIHSSKRNTNKD